MKVWPVIHVRPGGLDLARYNFHLAAAEGCEGVFFISMDGNDALAESVARTYSCNSFDIKIGVNFLRQSPLFALDMSISNGFDATWSDHQGAINGRLISETRAVAHRLPMNHRFFSGVAFKGQPHDDSPRESAALIVARGLIPTTSGPGTGMAPDLKKIHAFGLPNNLAIASGLTPDNVAMFKPYAAHALVSTGISRTFHEFDPVLLRRFMEAAR